MRNAAHSQMSIQLAQNRYNGSRGNILLIAGFSLFNVISLALGSYTYFLFSASIPYLLVDTARYLCGKYPEEFYEGGYEAYNFYDNTVFALAVVVALLIIAFYVLCYLLSRKNKVGWVIAALVFFVIDTLVLLTNYNIVDSLLDVLFHIYAIVTLIACIVYYCKLKRLTKENAIECSAAASTDATDIEGEATEAQIADSTPLRVADTEGKSRVFIEHSIYDHNIVYRRVGKTNELVIDGNVYAQYTARVELSHVLTAYIDGHEICVGLNASTTFLAVDGVTIITKIRWI